MGRAISTGGDPQTQPPQCFSPFPKVAFQLSPLAVYLLKEFLEAPILPQLCNMQSDLETLQVDSGSSLFLKCHESFDTLP